MALKKLNSFISSERECFDTRYNNIFTFAFSEIMRYYEFITIISKRYNKISKLYINSFNEFWASLIKKPGVSHPMTPQQIQLQEKVREITTKLHLEIESFYLFVKILLDKLSRNLWLYFGTERGLSLASHDKLSKNIEKYCSKKGLEIDENFITLIKKLKNDISNFRDKQITHLNDLRTLRGTGFGPNGNIRISLANIYPEPSEKQRESTDIKELLNSIDAYIQKTIQFIQKNSKKTNLQLKS